MPERTVADLLVERLRAWRVPRAFGYPGAAIAPLLEALDRAGGDPEFIPARHEETAAGLALARHEETAAVMATGHAKFTGEIGVCLATHGPSAVAPTTRGPTTSRCRARPARCRSTSTAAGSAPATR